MKLKPLPALPLLDRRFWTAARSRARPDAERQFGQYGGRYRAAMRYWAAWFELRYGGLLRPALARTAVVQFVVDHARRQTEQGLTSEMPAALDQELVRLKVRDAWGRRA